MPQANVFNEAALMRLFRRKKVMVSWNYLGQLALSTSTVNQVQNDKFPVGYCGTHKKLSNLRQHIFH